MHSHLELRDASAIFHGRVCFENFSARLHPADRIAVMGPNGSGKTSLLKILHGVAGGATGLEGELTASHDYRALRMEQFPHSDVAESGGEIIQRELTRLLRESPDVLLLDEPTNHLDRDKRAFFLKRLQSFPGIVVVATHDLALARQYCSQLWIFEALPAHSTALYRVRIFDGGYDAYRRERAIEERAHAVEWESLKSRKRKLEKDREQENRRAAGSRRANRNENDRNLLRSMQERGSRTAGKTGRRTAAIEAGLAADRAAHRERNSQARRARFRFAALPPKPRTRAVLSVRDGVLAFDEALFAPVSFTLRAGESLAVSGNNGAGKSTLLRSIFGNSAARRSGEWHLPAGPGNAANDHRIAWIDQFFGQLDSGATGLDVLRRIRPDWKPGEVRRHLNDALFSTNADVNRRVGEYSGGERARLSFACIAARPPALLLLDEINNHLDPDTRRAIAQALAAFLAAGGAALAVSHDDEFLRECGITEKLRLRPHPRSHDSGGD